MRALAIIPALAIPVFAAVGSCATQTSIGAASAEPASIELSGNDCGVIAAVAREHYRFGPDNPAPPLKEVGEPGWRPQCDWPKHGLVFADHTDGPEDAGPRERLTWVEFGRPRYDSRGAVVETGIMHGPLAGMGYECRVVSGYLGWTLDECRQTWVS